MTRWLVLTVKKIFFFVSLFHYFRLVSTGQDPTCAEYIVCVDFCMVIRLVFSWLWFLYFSGVIILIQHDTFYVHSHFHLSFICLILVYTIVITLYFIDISVKSQMRQNLEKAKLKSKSPDFFIEDPTSEIKRMLYLVSTKFW